MSEIDKLYSLAGVEKEISCNGCEYFDEYWTNGTYCSTCKKDISNEECEISIKFYPPFTAEKQIELIKWLAKNKQGFGLDYYAYLSGSAWECGVQFEWEVYEQRFEHSEFSESLSGLINDLWQDLTEAKQNEIKDILKG